MRKLLLIALLCLPMIEQAHADMVYNLPGGQVDVVLSTSEKCEWNVGYYKATITNRQTGGELNGCYRDAGTTYHLHMKNGDKFAYMLYPKTKFVPILEISYHE